MSLCFSTGMIEKKYRGVNLFGRPMTSVIINLNEELLANTMAWNFYPTNMITFDIYTIIYRIMRIQSSSIFVSWKQYFSWFAVKKFTYLIFFTSLSFSEPLFIFWVKFSASFITLIDLMVKFKVSCAYSTTDLTVEFWEEKWINFWMNRSFMDWDHTAAGICVAEMAPGIISKRNSK